MDAKTALEIVRLVERVLGKGKPGNAPQTHKIEDRDITVNTITTATERGYELKWTVGEEDFTAKLDANGPSGKITKWT